MKLSTVELYHVGLRLREPYELSFETLDQFDVLLTKFGTGDRTEWGEVVPLPGYSGTSFEETINTVRSLCQRSRGKQVDAALDAVMSHVDTNAFAVSAVAPPLERLTHRFETEACRMPLTGIVSSDVETEQKLSEIAEAGFSVVKLKAHGNVERDVKLTQKVLSNCALPVRVDANQAYSLDGATAFVEAVAEHPEHDRIQVFEQPLSTDRWEETAELRSISRIPIGLDESIWSVQDAERATDCADVIKLKLAKHGSLERTVKIAEGATRNDLDVLLGNGVAGELSAIDEAALWQASALETAGENNGYLKCLESVLVDGPEFESGSFIPPQEVSVDEQTVHDATIQRWTF